jgi:hypothetical protein
MAEIPSPCAALLMILTVLNQPGRCVCMAAANAVQSQSNVVTGIEITR